MTKDDDKLIWRALTEQASPEFTEFHSDDKTHDREGEEPGPMVALDPRDEEEEGGCPNLDKLIHSAESDEEDDDDTVVARQGRDTTAAQFRAANNTPYG
jgi:hypothetical protein